MRKAMGQVFGDIDERKTAAQKLQKLQQTNSVRNYITEFQTITANLDWDNETLADKFQEGVKQNIRSALIYFPTDLKNLEELFERAQKIDREQWSQRERQDYRTRRYFSKRNVITRDREGDVIMTSARVSTEIARK
jgi:Retrotransposon gag protein